MTSNNQPLYCENCSRYPYVSRVSIGKEDRVDLVFQFVKKRFVANYYYPSIFYTAPDIIGAPTKFPNYESFETYDVSTSGSDISISPFRSIPLRQINFGGFRTKLFMNYINNYTNNYINIEFHEAVYPIRVSMYETYNPGSVIQIWAQESDNQWFLLWSEHFQTVPPTSRIFSPPLQPCNFKTKMLKLCFKKSTWNSCDHAKLDAVMLIGISELIVPKNLESLINLSQNFTCMCFRHEHIHNFTTNNENGHLNIIHLQENLTKHCIDKSDIGKINYKNNLGQNLSREVIPNTISSLEEEKVVEEEESHNVLLKNDSNDANRIKLSSGKSKELPRSSLFALSDDIILEIFQYLDLTSLCRMNQIDRRLNNLTRDPLLYTRLNVRNVRNTSLTSNIFRYFTPRCKYLKQLDLTLSDLPIKKFETFLTKCGKNLTHLRLSKCRFANDRALLKIAKICKNLKELDLSYCHYKNFSHLEKLKNLEHLDLRSTSINTQQLCKILQKNQQMRELHLSNWFMKNTDEIAIELSNSCRDVEIVNFHLTGLTAQGFDALADCKNLRKVNFRPGNMIDDDRLHKFLSSCQRLEEIHLFYMILTDRNLNLLTQCKNLKLLYLYGARIEAPDKYSVILDQCPKLQNLSLISCNIGDCLINQWKKRYPCVSVYTYDD